MKVAVIGSRELVDIDLDKYLPKNATEIGSGGAKGVDSLARNYAKKKGLKLSEFLPEYEKYARAAPLKRNDLIIEYADEVVAFWNGKSKGTAYVISKCKKQGKKITVYEF